MKTASIRSTKPKGTIQTPRKQPQEPVAQEPHTPPLSPCDDLQGRIATRAYELYSERGCQHGYALDDWLAAEREILSQIPPV